MQQLIAISELKSRAEAIGSSLRKLAIAANVHPSTAYRALNEEHDIGAKKVRAMHAELMAQERKVAKHLVGVGVGEVAA